ncbi:MAG: hypothetical protein ABEJ69_03985 [Candidatus Nanohaloarchaea archaeon]
MKPEKVFRRYDIRGEYPGEINGEFAERLGRALGTFARENFGEKVVVGRDNKDSSVELKAKLVKGLVSTGVKVYDAGEGPTDYLAFAASRKNAVGVQVTSSHMPLDFNGFKFVYPEGNGFVNEDLYKVQDLFRAGDFVEGDGSVTGNNLHDEYREQLKSYFEKFFDSVEKKVVVDTLGGAATGFLPRLLEELGADVIDISEEREGIYVDPPEPKPGLLEHVERRFEEEGADLALATDMDADRIALYFKGEWVSGDELFALFARLVEGDVVASVDTSPAVEELVESRGDSIYYTRVGDPFVISEMIETGSTLSGEPNGHYCFPEFVNYNSGTLAGLLLAGMNLEEELEAAPDYFTERRSVEVEDKNAVMEEVTRHAREEYDVINEMDGVKFSAGGATVLVRPSGSSPVVRVIAQARDGSEAGDMAEEVAAVIGK